MKMLPVDLVKPDPNVLAEAAKIINAGGLVAFPTETVYGIGADGTNQSAIRKIYQVKGREKRKPILVIVGKEKDIIPLTQFVPAGVENIIGAFWPGPLTLIFPAAKNVAPDLLGQGSTIGIRYTSSVLGRELCRVAGCPITAPSANLSGCHEPLSAEDVAKQIGDKVDLILDGGASFSKEPSTVVDVSGDRPILVRAGGISFSDIMEIWDQTAEIKHKG